MKILDILFKKDSSIKSKDPLIKQYVTSITTYLKRSSNKNFECNVRFFIEVSDKSKAIYSSNIFERLFPIAYSLNFSSELDLYIFNNGYKKLRNADIYNFRTYMNSEIIKHSYIGGGTSYSPFMNSIIKEYRFTIIPTLNIVLTGSINTDNIKTNNTIIEASELPMFWQFIGIGDFDTSYLKSLESLKGRSVNNLNILHIKNIAEVSDEELYTYIVLYLSKWIKEASKCDII